MLLAKTVEQLNGDLKTHVRNLEEIESSIAATSSTCNDLSVAFILNELRSRVQEVLINLRSYLRYCDDLVKFGAKYDTKDLKTNEGMLSFIEELSNYSEPLKKQVNAIIIKIRSAKEVITENNRRITRSWSRRSSRRCECLICNFIVYVWTKMKAWFCFAYTTIASYLSERPRTASALSRSQRTTSHTLTSYNRVWVRCEEKLDELTTEVQGRLTVIHKYSEEVNNSLSTWKHQEHSELQGGIMNVKDACTKMCNQRK